MSSAQFTVPFGLVSDFFHYASIARLQTGIVKWKASMFELNMRTEAVFKKANLNIINRSEYNDCNEKFKLNDAEYLRLMRAMKLLRYELMETYASLQPLFTAAMTISQRANVNSRVGDGVVKFFDSSNCPLLRHAIKDEKELSSLKKEFSNDSSSCFTNKDYTDRFVDQTTQSFQGIHSKSLGEQLSQLERNDLDNVIWRIHQVAVYMQALDTAGRSIKLEMHETSTDFTKKVQDYQSAIKRLSGVNNNESDLKIDGESPLTFDSSTAIIARLHFSISERAQALVAAGGLVASGSASDGVSLVAVASAAASPVGAAAGAAGGGAAVPFRGAAMRPVASAAASPAGAAATDATEYRLD